VSTLFFDFREPRRVLTRDHRDDVGPDIRSQTLKIIDQNFARSALGCGDAPKDGFAGAHLVPLSLDFAPRKSVTVGNTRISKPVRALLSNQDAERLLKPLIPEKRCGAHRTLKALRSQRKRVG
jgi:hypothetical protein